MSDNIDYSVSSVEDKELLQTPGGAERSMLEGRSVKTNFHGIPSKLLEYAVQKVTSLGEKTGVLLSIICGV